MAQGNLTAQASSLHADHEALEAFANEILATIVEGDRKRMPQAISALQAAVAAHLADEERELLPGYAKHDPHDAARIMEDHAGIRKALAELDLETDLHLLRAEAMRALLTALQAHAGREEAGMYRWATLPPPAPRLTTDHTSDRGDRS